MFGNTDQLGNGNCYTLYMINMNIMIYSQQKSVKLVCTQAETIELDDKPDKILTRHLRKQEQ